MGEITTKCQAYHLDSISFDDLKKWLVAHHYDGKGEWTADPQWSNDAELNIDDTWAEVRSCRNRGMLTSEQFLDLNAAVYAAHVRTP